MEYGDDDHGILPFVYSVNDSEGVILYKTFTEIRLIIGPSERGFRNLLNSQSEIQDETFCCRAAPFGIICHSVQVLIPR
jgi:hypothetical protein